MRITLAGLAIAAAVLSAPLAVQEARDGPTIHERDLQTQVDAPRDSVRVELSSYQLLNLAVVDIMPTAALYTSIDILRRAQRPVDLARATALDAEPPLRNSNSLHRRDLHATRSSLNNTRTRYATKAAAFT